MRGEALREPAKKGLGELATLAELNGRTFINASAACESARRSSRIGARELNALAREAPRSAPTLSRAEINRSATSRRETAAGA